MGVQVMGSDGNMATIDFRYIIYQGVKTTLYSTWELDDISTFCSPRSISVEDRYQVLDGLQRVQNGYEEINRAPQVSIVDIGGSTPRYSTNVRVGPILTYNERSTVWRSRRTLQYNINLHFAVIDLQNGK